MWHRWMVGDLLDLEGGGRGGQQDGQGRDRDQLLTDKWMEKD